MMAQEGWRSQIIQDWTKPRTMKSREKSENKLRNKFWMSHSLTWKCSLSFLFAKAYLIRIDKWSVWSILRKEFFSQKQLLNAFLKILRTRFPNFVFKEAPTAQKRNFCLILIIRSRFENFIMLSTSWLKAFFSIPINETKKDWHSQTFFRTIQIN